jgi:hypothetical protein
MKILKSNLSDLRQIFEQAVTVRFLAEEFEIVPPIVEGSGGPERQSDYAAALVRATVDEPIRHRSLRLASSIHN